MTVVFISFPFCFIDIRYMFRLYVFFCSDLSLSFSKHIQRYKMCFSLIYIHRPFEYVLFSLLFFSILFFSFCKSEIQIRRTLNHICDVRFITLIHVRLEYGEQTAGWEVYEWDRVKKIKYHSFVASYRKSNVDNGIGVR